MKVAINNYCNSKCPYCFAGNMGVDENTSITEENFIAAIEWAIKTGEDNFTLLGGEPTLHPKIKKFIEIFNSYQNKYGIRLTILTNGAKLYKILDLLPEKTCILLNVVPEEELGVAGKIGLNLTLEKLINKRCFTDSNPYFTVALGCNIHHELSDYSYFWKISDYCNNHLVRTSVTSPQNSKWMNNRDDYFKMMKPIFLKFVDQALERKARVLVDCNEIPPCYFNGVEMAKISRLVQEGIYSMGACVAAVQYLPDLSCECCFGDTDFKTEKKVLGDFQNDNEARQYFYDKRIQRLESHYLDKCEGCEFKEKGWCYAGCFGFTDGKGENKWK